MPAGVPMAWMAGMYAHPPLFVSHGDGAYFEDVDGNRYLDMNQADLSVSCGFNPPEVAAAVQQRFTHGSQFLLPTEDAIVVSELLADRFPLPYWQYTLSASTANQEALRLARLATGAERVVLFDGGYHGHIEDTLAEPLDRGSEPAYLGLSKDAGRYTIRLPFNDLDAVAKALRPGDVACVITEPALTNVGLVLPDEGYMDGLRALTREHGVLLILDEAHTQSMAYGGLTRSWGLEPDILTLGKSLGGGIPIGAYGVTTELGSLMERHLDDLIAREHGFASGGTLYANALCMASARAALTHVLTPERYSAAEQLGTKLADGIDSLIGEHGLPWRAHRLGSRSGFCLTPTLPRNASQASRSIDIDLIDARRVFMANRGVWEAIASAGPAISFAHEEQDIDRYLTVLGEFLTAVVG